MKTLPWLTIVFMTIAFAGCDQLQGVQSFLKNKVQPRTAITEHSAAASHDNDVRLAQVILRPKQHKLSVQSDPFQPLFAPSAPVQENDSVTSVGEEGATAEIIAEEDPTTGIFFMGMMKVMDKASAFIKTPQGNGVYKINDKVGETVLAGIETDFITLTKGKKTFQIKRGKP